MSLLWVPAPGTLSAMSTVNPHFTFHYSQPTEYHFSHDSVFLARQAFEFFRDQGYLPTRGLDLCAGSGIIGLDFLFHCQRELGTVPAHFDFLEVQEIYRVHFAMNSQQLSSARTSLHFLQMNYADLLQPTFQDKYDLILCNPPYFHTGQGKLSPSDFKNRCRFFIDSDFPTLIRSIEHALAVGGHAFLLLRNQQEHGWDILAELEKHLQQVQYVKCADIRGTHCVLLRK